MRHREMNHLPPATRTTTTNTTQDTTVSLRDARKYAKSDLKLVADQLAKDVVFFRKYSPSMPKLTIFPYKMVPSYYFTTTTTTTTSLELQKRLSKDTQYFPFLPSRGKLQIPIAFLCEAKNDLQLLVIINYWRQLFSEQQRGLKKKIALFYLRPMHSNEPITFTARTYHLSPSKKPKTPWGFRCLETCTQLAESLGLLEDNNHSSSLEQACHWLKTANLESPRIGCKREGCIYPALARNNGYCCKHAVYFVPSPVGQIYDGRRDHKQRGSLLLGNVYTRPQRSCSCKNTTCVSIGYSSSMMVVDANKVDPETSQELWKHLELLDESDSPVHRKQPHHYLRLAPWHFHPQHRRQLPDGSWKLLLEHKSASSCFLDPVTNQKWKGILPPTYSLEAFLKEDGMKEYSHRKILEQAHGDGLPVWCLEYCKVEAGPYGRSESQKQWLLETNQRLMDQWNIQCLLSFSNEKAVPVEEEEEEETKKQNPNNRPLLTTHMVPLKD